MTRLAINGLGRIGRAVLRLALDDRELEIVAVNDRIAADNLAYLLRHDTVHGGLDREVVAAGGGLRIDGREIRAFRRRDPLLLPWRKLKVDVVIEATGAFRTARRTLRHRLAGAPKVVITSNPGGGAGGEIPILVRGVNERCWSGEPVVSAGSCSVNAAGVLLRILHRAFGVRSATLTSIHAYTRDQRLLDSGHPRDWRRGRAAAANIVPCASDAAEVLAAILPGLEGRLQGSAVRVPTADGSLMNIVCELESEPEPEAVNRAVRERAEAEFPDLLACSDDPLVSRDVVNDTHSAVFDAQLTFGLPGGLTRVGCWFDHEWGSAARVLEVARLIAGTPTGR